ncbi:MAG: lytic transglycosylase domain-containing protein [Pyrinomonadaceae bacterium]
MGNRRVFTVVLIFILALFAPVTASHAETVEASNHSQPHILPENKLEHLHLTATAFVRLNQTNKNAKLQKEQPAAAETGVVVGSRITLTDGYSFQVDEVWKDGDEIWYRQGKVSRALSQSSVKSIKPIVKTPEVKAPAEKISKAVTSSVEKSPAATWVHLVEGAKFRVDQVQQAPGGYWYSRANLSVFLERERVARIEIDRGESAAPAWRGSDWTSGNIMIDELIRTNGSRFGVDPYLVFLVIEQESHFRSRAVSPKGARGLMQLMPATARRFGVRDSFNVAENIKAGTQYLRELMDMFGGQVNLVLASYNAGEGAVLKYGRNVPPYRETRDYVKKIGKRYGLASRETTESETPAPRR